MFDFLFGSKDATKDWPQASKLSLTLDIGSGELNGIALGSPLESVRFLGPAGNDHGAKGGIYMYYEYGLQTNCDKRGGRIETFHLYYRPQMDKRFQQYPGKVLHQGKEVPVSEWQIEDFKREFGEPAEFGEEGDEASLTYFFRDFHLEVDFQVDPQNSSRPRELYVFLPHATPTWVDPNYD